MRIEELMERELSKKLQDWKENLKFHMGKTEQSAYDALVDLQDQDLHPLTDEEAEELMQSMGDTWINH